MHTNAAQDYSTTVVYVTGAIMVCGAVKSQWDVVVVVGMTAGGVGKAMRCGGYFQFGVPHYLYPVPSRLCCA